MYDLCGFYSIVSCAHITIFSNSIKAARVLNFAIIYISIHTIYMSMKMNNLPINKNISTVVNLVN